MAITFCRAPAREGTARIEPDYYSREADMCRKRLDPVSLTLAAQDFCQLVQGEEEKMADFIC